MGQPARLEKLSYNNFEFRSDGIRLLFLQKRPATLSFDPNTFGGFSE